MSDPLNNPSTRDRLTALEFVVHNQSSMIERVEQNVIQNNTLTLEKIENALTNIAKSMERQSLLELDMSYRKKENDVAFDKINKLDERVATLEKAAYHDDKKNKVTWAAITALCSSVTGIATAIITKKFGG